MPISINGTTGISGVDGSAGTPALQGSDTNTGIAFGSDVIIGSTGGTERFRCDSSGRMLVGTSSVSHNSRAVIAGRQDGNAAGTLVLESTSSSPANGDTLGNLRYGTSGNTASLAAAAIGAERDGGTWTNNSSMPTRLTFSTTADGASSPTERMRITSGGNVLVGDTALRDLTGQSFQVTGWGMFYQTLNGTTTSAFTHTNSGTQTVCLFRQGNPAATVGSITVSGGTSTAFNTSSDYRLKENIASVTDGIARLQQLKPSRFNFIANPDNTVDGFIAHEVQEVVPEAITGEKDAVDEDGNPVYQGIDQSKLVPLLTAALQEAVAKIESLEARIAALEVTP